MILAEKILFYPCVFEVYVQKSRYHMTKTPVHLVVLLLCILKYLKWIYNTNIKKKNKIYIFRKNMNKEYPIHHVSMLWSRYKAI